MILYGTSHLLTMQSQGITCACSFACLKQGLTLLPWLTLNSDSPLVSASQVLVSQACVCHTHLWDVSLWKVKMLELESLLTEGSPLVPSLTCLCLPSMVPATTQLCLFPSPCRASWSSQLCADACENNQAPGKGMEGSRRLTVCALHPLLSPGILPKHNSVLREVTEPFVNFPHWLSNVAGHSSL